MQLTQERELPDAIRIMRHRWEKGGYEVTLAKIKVCCAAHPNGCGYEEECDRLYDDRVATWRLSKGKTETVTPQTRETQEQKYSNYLPQLSRRSLIQTVRALSMY